VSPEGELELIIPFNLPFRHMGIQLVEIMAQPEIFNRIVGHESQHGFQLKF
jgi:hypothetical protein